MAWSLLSVTCDPQEVLSVAWSVDDNLLASSVSTPLPLLLPRVFLRFALANIPQTTPQTTPQSNAGALHVVDVRSGDVAFSATDLKPLSAVAFTRDGTRLVGGCLGAATYPMPNPHTKPHARNIKTQTLTPSSTLQARTYTYGISEP